MPSFFFVKPDLYQLSESEKLLLNCIQELGDSHSKKLAKLQNLETSLTGL